jgi:Protein of unknown function (DUF998)
MTRDLTTPRARAGTPTTRALLAGGAVAGPLFIIVGLLQAVTREGFDLRRHPLSLLSNGDLGWIQIANFVVTGLLFAAAAVGMRRVMHPGRGGTWGPLLVGRSEPARSLAGSRVGEWGIGCEQRRRHEGVAGRGKPTLRRRAGGAARGRTGPAGPGETGGRAAPGPPTGCGHAGVRLRGGAAGPQV